MALPLNNGLASPVLTAVSLCPQDTARQLPHSERQPPLSHTTVTSGMRPRPVLCCGVEPDDHDLRGAPEGEVELFRSELSAMPPESIAGRVIAAFDNGVQDDSGLQRVSERVMHAAQRAGMSDE